MLIDDVKYRGYTRNGEINFVGVVRKYFPIYTEKCSQETKITYDSYYYRIFSCIQLDKPVNTYDDLYIYELIQIIKQAFNYSDTTVDSTINHLVFDPVDCYFEDVWKFNPNWGRKDTELEEKDQTELYEYLAKIPKSLTLQEQMSLKEILFNDPSTDQGELLGLACMLFCTLRNNEAAGLRYIDRVPFMLDEEAFYFQVIFTTENNTSSLKLGGKTYNAVRRIPIIAELNAFLEKRMEFLNSTLEFPFENSSGELFNSVLELPIACRGNRYGDRCSTGDLSRAGKKVLQDIHMKKTNISAIEYMLRNNLIENGIGEKEVTTYLLRRNAATMYKGLMLKHYEIQYLMGHVVDDPRMRRSDYADEKLLYGLWEKLNKHPLNNSKKKTYQLNTMDVLNFNNINELELLIDATDFTLHLDVANNEYNDSICLDVNHPVNMHVIESFEKTVQNEEVNIKKAYESEE